jgi:Na+/melibiose symporter-like transporter
MRKLKQISQWAYAHPKKALACIVAIKLILIFLSYYIGNYLKDSGYLFGPIIFIVVVTVCAIIAFLYPRRKKWLPFQLYFYEKQKACDFLITLCFFFMMCWLFNQERLPALQTISMAVAPTAHPPAGKPSRAEEILNSLSSRDKSSLTRKEKRILKTEFKRQIGIFTKATVQGDKEKSGSSWRMILAIFAAVGLSLVLAALVCSLSCGGSDTAAVLVAVIGFAGIIIGLVYVIKGIKKREKKRQLKKKEEEQKAIPST